MTGEVVAAVDCGTNTIRLLIARRGDDNSLTEITREMQIVRLGQGVDATGEFHPDALHRTFAAVESYADLIRTSGAGTIRFVATSAARDVANREAFFDGVEQRLGVRPEVISGDEEAALSFAGAVHGLPGRDAPILVMDIGGGSTELIVGSAEGLIVGSAEGLIVGSAEGLIAGDDGGGIRTACSLDIGSVRITERCWPAGDDPDPGPPTARQVAGAADIIDARLDGSGIDFASIRSWIGVAGTVTSMAAIALELPEYEREQVHGSRFDLNTVRAVALRLRTTPVAELRTLGCLHPQRADVIAAGALIADRVSCRLTVDALDVSESDILDGIVRGLLP